MSQKWPIFIWAGGQCDWLKQSNSGVLGTTRPVILWFDLHLHYKELISEFGPQPQDGSEVKVCSGLQQQHEQEHGGAQLPPEEGLRHQVLRHWTNDQGCVTEPKLRFPGKLRLSFTHLNLNRYLARVNGSQTHIHLGLHTITSLPIWRPKTKSFTRRMECSTSWREIGG